MNLNVIKIQVQIVTFNSAKHLINCLLSVVEQTRCISRVIIIDNHSTDTTLELINQFRISHGLNLDIVCLDGNLGYAAAHNIGFYKAIRDDFSYVLTLNPDVILYKDYIRSLISVLVGQKYGGATGKLLRPTKNGTAKREIDSAGLRMEAFYHVRDRGADQVDKGQYDEQEVVWGVCGAAAMYNVAMLKDLQIEGQILDETFFVYKEDVELCWRAHYYGWSFLYVPSAQAIHERGWKSHTDVPDYVSMHSFVNQISLLITLVPRVNFYVLSTFIIELFRYVILAFYKPIVALRIMQSLWANRMWLRKKRKILFKYLMFGRF